MREAMIVLPGDFADGNEFEKTKGGSRKEKNSWTGRQYTGGGLSETVDEIKTEKSIFVLLKHRIIPIRY